MIDLSTFSRYYVTPSGDVVNPYKRVLPPTRTLRLVDDFGKRRLVTRNRLIYSRLFGEVQQGDVICGTFPDLYIRKISRGLDELTIQAVARRINSGVPYSVIARDLRIDIKQIGKYFGKTNKSTTKNL